MAQSAQPIPAQAAIFAPDVYAQQVKLLRQQKLAEMLQTQGLEAPQGQMVSGHYVAPAATQHLARLASALGGTYLNSRNDEQGAALAQQQRDNRIRDMKGVLSALQGTPGNPGIPLPDDMVGPRVAPTAATPGDPKAAMALALQSGDPMLQGIGSDLLKQQMKGPEGININGQMVDKFTGKPLGARIDEAPKPFTLSPGETRYGVDGKPIAQINDFNKPFMQTGAANTPYQTYEMSKSRAGAPNVNNTVSIAGPENKYNSAIGETLAKESTDLVGIAKQAPEVIRNAQMIREVLDKGAITGTGAESRLAMQKAFETVGLVGKGKAEDTQALISGLGKLTLAGVKTSGLGASNGFTDKDRVFLEGAISGTIDSTPGNLRRVADLSERIARANHSKGTAVLNRWKNDPALKAVAQDSIVDAIPAGDVQNGMPSMGAIQAEIARRKGGK